jgi:hypothetical protein
MVKNVFYFSIGVFVFVVGCILRHPLFLTVGIAFTVLFGSYWLAAASPVVYKGTQYRLHHWLLFWKKAQWKSMTDVHKIMVRKVVMSQASAQYQVYLVHKHSYDMVYKSNSYASAKQEADRLAGVYRLVVEGVE